MSRFFEVIVRRKMIIIIVFIIAAGICGLLMMGVGQNYDMSKYLPEGSESKTGIDILKKEYSYDGTALLLLKDKSIVEALAIKQTVTDIEGVRTVIWLDNVADLKQPVELIDEEIRNNYLVGSHALLQIIFTEDDYSALTHAAITSIESLLGEDALLAGNAVDAYANVRSTRGNIMGGILIAAAIALVILILTTSSLMEVFLFLFTIGVAIVMNMGTNIVFSEISYMTYACAAILQLAVSMDYSIFLLHRFEYERETEKNAARAMVLALKASFSSIVSSGATTLVGFIALVFMSYTMGADMGFVLAKGILFSLICVLLLLPALTVVFVKAIDKTHHRRFLPSLKKVQHILGGKARYIVLAVLAAVSVISFLAQSKNMFFYSASSTGDKSQLSTKEVIEDLFGYSNNFVVLVPRADASNEYALASEIKALKQVKSVQGLYAFIDSSTPVEIVPEYLKNEFLSANYSRYIVEVAGEVESDTSLEAVEQIRKIVAARFDNAFVTGASPVIYDIKIATSDDFSLITILSIVFVGIILLLTFRSLTIPIVLLFVIQASIWINMSVPYFQATPMIFLGYMVVSAVQLGATIDYAILMTNYYLEGRKTLAKREAAEYAVDKAGASIMISSLVLASAGFVVAGVFVQPAMAQLGTLIGRGALLSGFLAIFILPQMLTLLDRVIKLTTLKKIRWRRRTNFDN